MGIEGLRPLPGIGQRLARLIADYLEEQNNSRVAHPEEAALGDPTPALQADVQLRLFKPEQQIGEADLRFTWCLA